MSDLYSNYARRVPHHRSQKFIMNWHRKHVDKACRLIAIHQSWLEVGPGHGYVAEIVSSYGFAYRFVDTSQSIVNELSAKGYTGKLCRANELNDAERFDVVYLSHVLEHSSSWNDAREMLVACRKLLNPGGHVVIVSPDILSWRREFWNVDHTHGYPTSLRNVCQLVDDVGLAVVAAHHHRNGGSNLITRGIFAFLASCPHRIIDRLISPTRAKVADGPTYSWKAVFGWRQVFVVARLNAE